VLEREAAVAQWCSDAKKINENQKIPGSLPSSPGPFCKGRRFKSPSFGLAGARALTQIGKLLRILCNAVSRIFKWQFAGKKFTQNLAVYFDLRIPFRSAQKLLLGIKLSFLPFYLQYVDILNLKKDINKIDLRHLTSA
jgi:hypothetical protein